MAKSRSSSGSGTDALEEALDEVYLGNFEGFVTRRNELAKLLRAQGSGEAAERVRALKKPSRVAWAVNQLSARDAALRDGLLDAGAALRRAHERLVGGEAGSADLRAIGEQERAAVGAALDALGVLASDAGVNLSPAALERARQTLHAVTLDEGVRRDFERGRLSSEHEATGLGGLSLGAAPPVRKGGGKRSSGGKDRERLAARRRAEELEAAEAEARELERSHRNAEEKAEAARRSAEEAQRDLKLATAALSEAESAASAARGRVDGLRERGS